MPRIISANLNGIRSAHKKGFFNWMAAQTADFICVQMGALETQPMYNPISQLVYSSGRSQVSDAWIAGECRLRDGELVDFDSVGLLERVQRWRGTIAAVRASA